MITLEDQKAFGRKVQESGLVTREQLSEAESHAEEKGVPIHRYLIEAGWLKKETAYEALAGFYGVPYVDVSNFKISQEAVQSLPAELAHRYKAVPLFKLGESLNVAMENPADVAAIDHLAQKTKCQIDACLGALEDIDAALTQHYGSARAVSTLLESLSRERSRRPRSVSPSPLPRPRAPFEMPKDGKASVVSLVDLILRQAHEEGASDIHVEPEEKMLRIRYRVDGVLHEASTAPKELESEIISRIKILSEMDIAETRVPQDGRMKLNAGDQNIDIRVSSVPTVYGENIVMRLLKDSKHVPDFAQLGMSREMQKQFEALIQKSYGMILETGPTGSGKTTSLYAALNRINSVERNIITIEDPVEYKLPMIRQIPVNNKAGLNFAAALRSILRQDPDVIMVGEIRDRETAEIAIQAAMTGHLVFSTLHTNNAATVVTRLADMKIEPFLIAASVVGAISQRLVRKLCDKCREPETPGAASLRALQVPEGEILKAFKGKGCHHCRQTGYKGRIGIFEILRMDESVCKKIIGGGSVADIEAEARKNGFKSMREDGIDKIREGLTSLEEVIKAVSLA